MMTGGMTGGMWMGMLFSLVFFLLVVVGIVLLTIWAVRRFGSSSTDRRDEALETLRARYARGEIDQEEFRGMRAELEDRAQIKEELPG